MRGIISRNSGDLVGLEVLMDAPLTVWLAPDVDALQQKVDARWPGQINALLCSRCGKQEAELVFSHSDRNPGHYLLHKLASNGWQPLGSRRPPIDASEIGRLQFKRIKARDGHDLPVWVTHPATADMGPRAAVLLVHGGPWMRGRSWSWNAASQVLAWRSDVVIDPEFRGSTGDGDAHFRAGFKQWGQAMQDDVSDAVQWAAKQRWTDLSRACFKGCGYGSYGSYGGYGGYGGYAAMMGLAKRPEECRCGMAAGGVRDPRLLFSIFRSDLSPVAKRSTLREMVGDPVADATMLRNNAPLERATDIKAQLLLAYCSNHRRLPIEHGERMRNALTKAGSAARVRGVPQCRRGMAIAGNTHRLLAARGDFSRKAPGALNRALRLFFSTAGACFVR